MAEAELSILLRLRDEATSELKKLNSELKENEKTWKSNFGSIISYGKQAAIAVGVLGAAITGFAILSVKQFADTGAELSRLNLITGISIETLSVLKYMAESTGGSISDVQMAFRGMAQYVKQVSEHQQDATETLRTLGLSYSELKAANPEQQFMMLATAVANVENATTRAALAQDVFGRGGMALLPVFAQGVDGLQKMAENAQRLGVVYDSELVQKSLLVNQSFTDMKAAMQGLQIAIGTALAPTIVYLVTKLTDLLVSVRNFVIEHPGVAKAAFVIGVAMVALATALGTVLTVLTAIGVIFPAVSAGIAAIGIAAGIATPMIAGLMGVLLPLLAALAVFAGAYLLTTLSGLPDIVGDLADKLHGIKVTETTPRTKEIRGFQYGGIVTSPTLAMIGESGPEAVVPLSRGQGAGVYNLTVNVEGSVISDRDLVAYIRSELLMIKDRNYSTGI